MSITNRHPNMKWEEVKDKLEFKIISGNLKGGDKFLSIAEVAKTFGVSKTTAKKVLELMCNDGTISKRTGIGFFVMPYKKSELRDKHIRALNYGLEKCFRYATLLNVSNDELTSMIRDITHGEE